MDRRLLSRPLFWETCLLIALTGGALALRLYRLGDLPPGMHGDEAAFALEAVKITHGDLLGIWTPVTLGHATGHLYWTAFIFKLSHPSVFTLRLTMALLGAATVPVAYLLIREMFSKRVAFITAALIAFSSWHLTYSRAGWTIVPAALVLLLGLYFFVRGWRSDSWRHMVIGGIILGLGFYTHKNFPFYFAGVWALLLPRLLFDRSKAKRASLGIFLLYSFLSALPFLIFFLTHRSIFSERLHLESFFNGPAYTAAHGFWSKAKVFLDRVREVLLYVHNPVPVDGVDGVGGRPLLGRIAESFFWLGFLATLIRLRRMQYQFIIVGLFAGVIPVFLVLTGEQRRLLATMPFIMLCIALGLDTSLRVLAGGYQRLARVGPLQRIPRLAGGAAAALGIAGFLAFFSFTNVTYYFKDWVTSYDVKWAYSYDLVRVIERLKTFDQDTYVYFYSERWSYDYETRRFLLPGMQGEDRSLEFGGDGGIDRRHEGKVVYVFMGEYVRLGEQVLQRFQQAEPYEPYFEAHEEWDTDGRRFAVILEAL
ncbi:MAG: glycosyltransferase family 39 protein [Chloroflexi bacterium]|nr:glycosyltransferase family 39 protein [Chloroflexota bacterium]